MPPWHPHWSFLLCDCYLLPPSNSSVICPIGRQVPCNDNLSTLTFLTPVVPLLGSRASAHPASARLRNRLQRETLSVLHQSRNAVGNCQMCSWMIGDSPTSPTTTTICSTASMEGPCYGSCAIHAGPQWPRQSQLRPPHHPGRARGDSVEKGRCITPSSRSTDKSLGPHP